MSSRTRVVIVGEMGAGKSTVGRLAAATLAWPYRDNDEVLEARTGRTAAEIAAGDGTDVLHVLERQVLDELLDEEGPSVVAAPGAVAAFTIPAELRERAFVVWLRASPEVLAERAATSTHRPLPADDRTQLFTRLAAERDAFFTRAAHLVIDVERSDPAQSAARAVDALRAHQEDTAPGDPDSR